MSLKKIEKKELINKFRLHEKDCGSVEIQISLLSKNINILTEHFKIFKKDFHSRRGLIIKISKRKKLLKYLKITNKKKYISIINNLGLRK